MTSLASCFQELSQKERLYCEARLSGMTQVAAGAAAGIANPKKRANAMEQRPQVQTALIAAMQISADEVGFTRKDAHDMLMSAYYNADTAAEQIAAVRELIKLHGIAAPVVIEHDHTHTHELQLEHMPLDELIKLAGEGNITLEGEFKRLSDRKPEQLEMDVKTDAEGTGEIQG